MNGDVRLEALCPECGDPLSVSIDKNRKTGKIEIAFWCEGAGGDIFEFQMLTGLKNKDLEELKDVGKIIWKRMGIKLIARKAEPH